MRTLGFAVYTVAFRPIFFMYGHRFERKIELLIYKFLLVRYISFFYTPGPALYL